MILADKAACTTIPCEQGTVGKDDAEGFGIYYPPQSPTNWRQSVAFNGDLLYAEDRRLAVQVLGISSSFRQDTQDYYNVVVRTWTTGLLRPSRVEEAGYREALRGEFFVFFGTVAEIEAAAARIEDGALYRNTDASQ